MKMGIEQNGSGGNGKGKVSNESRKGKRRLKKMSAVQRLYETCKQVFADCGPGVVPPPDKVHQLALVLDGMSEADVGLRATMPFFSVERAPIITYLQLYECDKFSIGIFCLPPTTVIPLHNHPGMTVFSKLLFGTMHIRSFDWADHDCATMTNATQQRSDVEGLRVAKLKVNSEFTAPCTTSILYPTDGGNMHRFTAKTACAVLDVLGPPYSDPEGRHCQYYHDFPFNHFQVEKVCVGDEEEEQYAWLKERDLPKDHAVVGVPYKGPKILKT